MNGLVQRNENGKPITNSLLVAEKFEKNHFDVIASIRSILSSKENSLLLSMFVETTYIASNGKSNPMYYMNRDGFSLLAMGFTGQKALNFKMEFINAFNKMDSMLQSDEYILARSQEILQNRVKLLEEKTFALEERNNIQTEQLKLQAPKTKYYDEVLQSSSTYNTTQIAKELGMSSVTLNKKLKDLGIQYKQRDQWLLMQKYSDRGYTKTRTFPYIDYNENLCSKMSTVWTEKGREFIHSIFHESL